MNTHWQRKEGSSVPGRSVLLQHSAGNDRQVKLIVIGDMGCGKTSLSIRFCNGVFVPVVGTVGVDFHVRTVAARDGQRVQARVWDTAGQERHRALVKVLFCGVHGCLLVYDCTRADTFANVAAWADELLAKTRVPVPTVLVGNKTDEYDLREVSYEEGAALAEDLCFDKFFETSAKDGSNVEAAFLALVDSVLQTGEAPRDTQGDTLRLVPSDDGAKDETKRSCSC